MSDKYLHFIISPFFLLRLHDNTTLIMAITMVYLSYSIAVTNIMFKGKVACHLTETNLYKEFIDCCTSLLRVHKFVYWISELYFPTLHRIVKRGKSVLCPCIQGARAPDEILQRWKKNAGEEYDYFMNRVAVCLCYYLTLKCSINLDIKESIQIVSQCEAQYNKKIIMKSKKGRKKGSHELILSLLCLLFWYKSFNRGMHKDYCVCALALQNEKS